MKPHDNIGTREDLVKYRLETAKDDLRAARILFDAREYKAANNRAYYAIFRAINAVHAMDGKACKRHKDVIANFNREYVKTEIFPRRIGREIAQAEEIRHASDYDDFYFATKEEAEEQIKTATELIAMIEVYCEKQLEQEGDSE
ncbi:MAG: HEPN domain-containing protein [Lachnospiraceae bacterium]|nr:HEPN domain-containing protein [Lachnospiraceae bacterium]